MFTDPRTMPILMLTTVVDSTVSRYARFQVAHHTVRQSWGALKNVTF